jgi:glycogen debranching enzyme
VLDLVLSPEGYAYASAAPVEEGDPGRFHALYGRDSLITALQLLPDRPDTARATLRALARLQGQVADAETNEEPGKILHELWLDPPPVFAEQGWPLRHGELRYYGSADSTCWFLVVLAALDDADLTGELEPAWRAAGAWLARALEHGGGFVRHGLRTARGGLDHQGWRDTSDPLDPSGYGGGIVREDGSAPAPPLADADTQAIAFAALGALTGLDPGERGWPAAAAGLAGRIQSSFGPETMALEGDGRPVRGAGSQLGWLLWAGALRDAAAHAAAERLTQPDVLTDFGLRTLAEGHPAFRAHGYHRGSVWPFDCWLGFGGLRAVGFEREAERVRTGVLEAIERLGGAPELYAVGPSGPERIPLANHVQAWTIGARDALLRGWDGRAAA